MASRTAMAVPQRLNTQRFQIRKYSSEHEEETFEEFTSRFEKEFEEAYDLFEVQRVLNNCFSYDLVPAPAVIEKALRAARSCLLYTSPSPRDTERSRMPSSA